MPVLTWKRVLALALVVLAVVLLSYGLWAGPLSLGLIGLALLVLVVGLLVVGAYRRTGFGIQQQAEQRGLLSSLQSGLASVRRSTTAIEGILGHAGLRDLRPLVLAAFRDVRDDVGAARRELEQVAAGITALQRAVDALDARGRAIGMGVEHGHAAVAGVSRDLDALRTNIDTQVADLGRGLAEHMEAVADVRAAELERKFQALVAARSSELGQAVSALGERLSMVDELRMEAENGRHALEQQLGGVDAQLGDLNSNVGGRVRRLAGEIGGTRLRFDVLNDVMTMQRLLARFPLEGPMPPMSGWALEPVTLERLLDMVSQRKPKLVVECGSGVSTVWLASTVRAYGGRVVALEHLDAFATETRQELDCHGLAAFADVVTAPLETFELGGSEYQWYAREAWSGLADIDMLLIDGPPKATGPRARYPAVPLLAPALSAKATVILDDAHREEEQEVLSMWRDEWRELGPPVAMGRRAISLLWAESTGAK